MSSVGRSVGPGVSRRGSCSLEVMAGLRAKCHARSAQSTQQAVVVVSSCVSDVSDIASSQSQQQCTLTSALHHVTSAATTPPTMTTDNTSELPPDILQSRTYTHSIPPTLSSSNSNGSICIAPWHASRLKLSIAATKPTAADHHQSTAARYLFSHVCTSCLLYCHDDGSIA